MEYPDITLFLAFILLICINMGVDNNYFRWGSFVVFILLGIIVLLFNRKILDKRPKIEGIVINSVERQERSVVEITILFYFEGMEYIITDEYNNDWPEIGAGVTVYVNRKAAHKSTSIRL